MFAETDRLFQGWKRRVGRNSAKSGSSAQHLRGWTYYFPWCLGSLSPSIWLKIKKIIKKKNPAVSTARWQKWAGSNPVAWLCSWKPSSSMGERILHSGLGINPIHRSADLAPPVLLAGRGRPVPALLASMYSRAGQKNDPLKDIYPRASNCFESKFPGKKKQNKLKSKETCTAITSSQGKQTSFILCSRLFCS